MSPSSLINRILHDIVHNSKNPFGDIGKKKERKDVLSQIGLDINHLLMIVITYSRFTQVSRWDNYKFTVHGSQW